MNDKNARMIRAWLVSNGISQTSIAKELGVSGVMINRFITGYSQSQRVFDYFMKLGCPRKYFDGRPEARRAA